MYSGSPGPEWKEVGRRQSSSVSESHCEVEDRKEHCQEPLHNLY